MAAIIAAMRQAVPMDKREEKPFIRPFGCRTRLKNAPLPD